MAERTQVLVYNVFICCRHIKIVLATIMYNHNNIYGKVYRGGGLPFTVNALKYVRFDCYSL
jgi:hypothetical protein